jgi:alpha-glucosidase
MPDGWGDRSVDAQQADPTSMLTLARSALARRPHGSFAWCESPEGTLMFEREGIVCVVNVDGPPAPLPRGELLLASEAVDAALPAGAAAWLRR